MLNTNSAVVQAGSGNDQVQVGTWTDGKVGPAGTGSPGTWVVKGDSIPLDNGKTHASKDFCKPHDCRWAVGCAVSIAFCRFDLVRMAIRAPVCVSSERFSPSGCFSLSCPWVRACRGPDQEAPNHVGVGHATQRPPDHPARHDLRPTHEQDQLQAHKPR